MNWMWYGSYLEKAESELRWIESLHESRLKETDAADERRSTGRKKLMHTPYLVLPVEEKETKKADENPLVRAEMNQKSIVPESLSVSVKTKESISRRWSPGRRFPNERQPSGWQK